MKSDMFEGSEKARIKTLTVSVGKPTEKTTKTTENEDVCKSVKDGSKPFEAKTAKGGGPENTDVKKPVEKASCEAAQLRFDDIYNQIMEADGVGLDTQGANMNLDNGGFNDDAGDLGGDGDPDLDPDEADPDDVDDDDDDDGNAEDIANLKIAIKYLRKMIEKMGGDPDEDDDDDDGLDDLEVPEGGEGNGEDNGAGAGDTGGMNGGAGAGGQPPMQPQQESLQIGAKTNLGPKMSQKANGKLGRAKGKKFNWTGKKYDVSGQAKKASKSGFGPKMGKTVSNISKGEFIK